MSKESITIPGKGISLQLICADDIDRYYKAGFETEDPEVMRLTGTKHGATRDDIVRYVNRIAGDDTRYDFLILDGEQRIIGEAVLNGIDREIGSAGFRIALFQSADCGRGLGSEAIRLTVRFGFEQLGMHRIELEVLSFNTRAYRAYLRAGFAEEGRKRDAERIDGAYCDVILMAILEHEYAAAAGYAPSNGSVFPILNRA